MSRSVVYTSSPLLTSRAPVWRSKLVVAAIALAFGLLAARAVYIQVIGNEFFQRKGTFSFGSTHAEREAAFLAVPKGNKEREGSLEL